MWPAGLQQWMHRRAGSYVFASDRELAAKLRLEMDTIVRYFRREEPTNALFDRLQEDYRKMCSEVGNPASFGFELAVFPKFDWFKRPSHESLVWNLTYKIRTTVLSAAGSDISEEATQVRTQLIEGVAAVYLWVTYISHFSSVELDAITVYERIRAGQVEWPSSEVEILWMAYCRVCGGYEVADLTAALQVIVPDRMVLAPTLL